MNIQNATQSYEAWLGRQIKLLPADLVLKHNHMAEDIFPFLRATFYRWMQLWPEACPDCQKAPKVLAVGDLHVENFGTWRDVEGRLIWGINDFDEAFDLPYTIDLVRLATSAHLAIRGTHLQLGPKDACEAILSGYVRGLKTGGLPFVLSEEHRWLHDSVMSILRDPVQYWAKLESVPVLRKPAPKGARRAIEKMFPEPGLEYRLVHRIAGLGSLGRERYLALAEYRGGKVAREAKALAASACVWAQALKGSKRIRYQEILGRSVRAIDPFVQLKGNWIVRRLAPDCSRVELSAIAKERDEYKLLQCMGFETANVHLGTPKAARNIMADLNHRPEHWLHEAALAMVKATEKDWKAWRAAMPREKVSKPAKKAPGGRSGV